MYTVEWCPWISIAKQVNGLSDAVWFIKRSGIQMFTTFVKSSIKWCLFMLCKLTVLSELTMGMSVYGYMCTGQVTKSCPALCDAMDSPVFSINGIAWAKYWS